MPGAGCQVGVTRTSGQSASPVTDSLYFSAIVPSDFSNVFQPPMVVGQRHSATSSSPARAYSVSVGRSATGGFHILWPSLSSLGRASTTSPRSISARSSMLGPWYGGSGGRRTATAAGSGAGPLYAPACVRDPPGLAAHQRAREDGVRRGPAQRVAGRLGRRGDQIGRRDDLQRSFGRALGRRLGSGLRCLSGRRGCRLVRRVSAAAGRGGQRPELGGVELAPLHRPRRAQRRAVLDEPGDVDDALAQRPQQRAEVLLAAVAEQRGPRLEDRCSRCPPASAAADRPSVPRRSGDPSARRWLSRTADPRSAGAPASRRRPAFPAASAAAERPSSRSGSWPARRPRPRRPDRGSAPSRPLRPG